MSYRLRVRTSAISQRSRFICHCGKTGHWKVQCLRNMGKGKHRQATQKFWGKKPAKGKDSNKIDAVDRNVSDQSCYGQDRRCTSLNL